MIKSWAFLLLLMIPFQHLDPVVPPPVFVAEGDPGWTGIQADTVFWSPDSTKLYFTVEDAPTTQGSANITYEYDLKTKQTTQVDTPGYLINLTDEQQHFHAYSKQAFIAPNGENFVYLSTDTAYEEGEGGYYENLPAVGNLSDGTFMPIRDSYGNVRWSDDSSAFIMEHGTPGGDVFSYARDMQGNSCSWSFCDLSEVFISGFPENRSLYDLSPDGRRILFPSDGDGSKLHFWDVDRDTRFGESTSFGEEIPVGDNVIGAAFSLTDDNQIFVVDSDGIILYDLAKSTSPVLNPDINSTWANFASFSPDNREVALLADGDVLNQQVYVMPITP